MAQRVKADPELTERMRMEEQLARDTDPWMATPGEMLIGEVISVERRTSKYGAYPAVTVRQADGEELVFHGFRTVAKSELLRCRPSVGDEIGILYQGKVEGADYHGYRVRLNRVSAPQEFQWSEFDSPTADAADPDGDVPF
jgi:hypothetical protein